MGAADEEFLRTLRATFKVEAAEHLQTIANGLLELERKPEPEALRQAVATVFRAAHSLKGAARAVDFPEIEAVCQSIENSFAAWKRQDRAPSPADLDALHGSLNTITAALSREGPAPADRPAQRPEFPARAGFVPVPQVPERESPAPGETVRISVAKLDARLVESEEMLTAKITARQRAEDLRELARRFEAWRSEWADAGRAAASAGPARLLEFFDSNLDHVKSLETEVAALARSAEQDRHVVAKLVDDLLEDSKKLLLLPFSTLAAPFPKLVRDLCRDQGKEADLSVRGEELEIDKRILEQMKDPLIHLLRNCVDHGVEPPEARRRQGKPPRASITVAVAPVNGSKIELVVSDDGAGIDIGKVKDAAVRHGVLGEDAASRLGNEEAQALVFQADVSTNSIITQLSGRGLGLAIVRENAEKLGGRVSVESEPQRGTVFRIVLPSTLATFRGILIEAAGRRFVVPTTHVERATRVAAADIRTVERRETISFGGRALALARLADVLGLPPAGPAAGAQASVPAVIVAAGGQHIAFAVDAVLDEQEVLVKHLGKPLSRVRHVAGATVLGSGMVVPILNTADLIKSARNATGPAIASAAKPREAKTVLVAEDSITSRTLIKGILESAGYRVKTAVDGIEAFSLLRTEKFDLVVSDVEMPRLSGFDLTASIRADKRLAEIPVVLITALETREDRERGIDVGANAYIVKSKFDQSDLLDTVRRLA